MPRSSSCRRIWGAALAAAVGLAHAGADDEDLLQVWGDRATLSLATGARQTLRRAPAVATVLTADDIAAMGATDLDEVLEAVPGLHVNRAPSMGQSLYVMRGVVGLNAPQVLLLQDGVPVTVAISGNKGNLWGGFPVMNIARIEVLRGPGSALYGADAFAGVVNIVTRAAEDLRGVGAGMRAGSFGSRDGWLRVGGELGPLAASATLRVARTAGDDATIDADAQTRNDARGATHASLAPGPLHAGLRAVDGSAEAVAGRWRARVHYKLRDDMQTFAGIAQALDPLGRGRSARTLGSLGWSEPALAPHWSASTTLAWMRYRQTYPVAAQLLPPGVWFPTGVFAEGMRGGPEFAERHWRLSASAAYAGLPGHLLRVGAGHDDIDLYWAREYRNFDYTATGVPVPAGALQLTATPFILPQRRRVDYLFVQDEWQFARDWTLTAGLRHDRYSDFGATTHPRLALVWDTAVDLTTKLLYGSAFRAPAFTEQYSTHNPIGRGNPAIRPERNRTVELAWSWQARPQLKLDLNLFRYRMSEIIRTVPNPAPAPGTTYQNTGGQDGRGLEAELVWDAARAWRVAAHFSFQAARDAASGRDAGNAPRRHGYTRLDWTPAASWTAGAQLNHVADRRRVAGDTRPPVPDYTTLDLSVRTTRRGRAAWNLAAAVRNVAAADAREPTLAPGLIPNDLPVQPRHIWVQVTYEY